MKKLITILAVWASVLSVGYASWDNDKPADSDAWNNAAGFIRDNNDALEVELGIDLNEAHPYFQADAPTKKPDTTTDLDVDDNGRLWVDSDDNVVYILTDFSGPTWTAQTAASSIAASDPTFTLQNTDEENGDGGRQSRFIAKGEQDGQEVTTLGFTEFSHDGSSDDEKGKWRVVLNSGSEGNSPTNVPIEYTADGKIKVSTSLSVLDEDDLSSDGDKVLVTQQSVKTYIDNRGWTQSNTQVFATSMTTAATFQDLDLSATIGSNTALVFLSVQHSGSGGVYVTKEKGTGSAYTAYNSGAAGSGMGASTINFEGTNKIGHIIVSANSSGVIQHGTNNNSETITVSVIGYTR